MRRGGGRRTALGVAAVACAVAADLAAPGLAARAAERPNPVRDGALGTGGAVVRVERLQRTGHGLEVTLTVTNWNLPNISNGDLRDYLLRTGAGPTKDAAAPFGMIGVAALDPATGRWGQVRMNGTTCECGLISSLGKDKSATVVAVLDDPGGAKVDLVFDVFQPIPGVAVEGSGAPVAGATSTLAARSVTPLARTRDGAATASGTDRVDLATDVLFAFGSATLSPQANDAITKVAQVLKAQPRRKLAIYGHTDGIGTPDANLTLSRDRAAAVQAALAPLLGPGWTFDVQGLGETKPVAPEKTDSGADYPAGRALNRRVELRLQD
ncbi:MAG TPA: OmpA family protein [Kineosporiaceae bacterium]|nr:OmpA family protein [Kineosporiaceae bacterium]